MVQQLSRAQHIAALQRDMARDERRVQVFEWSIVGGSLLASVVAVVLVVTR